MSKANKLPPITPGEMLREEFLRPMGVSQYRLAKEIGVPAPRIRLRIRFAYRRSTE